MPNKKSFIVDQGTVHAICGREFVSPGNLSDDLTCNAIVIPCAAKGRPDTGKKESPCHVALHEVLRLYETSFRPALISKRSRMPRRKTGIPG